MKRYTITVDLSELLCGTTTVVVEAENEGQAIDLARDEAYGDASNGDISFDSNDGYNIENESIDLVEDLEPEVAEPVMSLEELPREI